MATIAIPLVPYAIAKQVCAPTADGQWDDLKDDFRWLRQNTRQCSPTPDRFDATRSPNRHLAFGSGAHQCLGLHLARLEMRILFEELLANLESLQLAGEPKRSSSVFVGGPKTLPITFKPV